MALSDTSDDWRFCVEWFIRCGVILPYHHVAQTSSEIFDLVNILRDGVYLCEVLNVLRPECVSPQDFYRRPQQSQILCLKNITTFLRTCSDVFKIDYKDLFLPYDLYYAENFKQVIQALSALSKCDVAQASGIPGFPPTEANVTQANHDYYNLLEEKAISHNWEAEPTYGTSAASQEDEIYNDLMKLSRSTTLRKSEKRKAQQKRQCIIEEILDTEKNYNEALDTIITSYVNPLSDLGERVLSLRDQKEMFGLVQELAKLHDRFYHDLQQSVNIGSPKLSGCFLRWKRRFLIYGLYCSNLPLAQDRIDELMKSSSAFSQKIKECEDKASATTRFPLRDLLRGPFQRVLRYPLLLETLLKATSKSDDDYAGLEKALDAMKDLSMYVNEVKRDNENLRSIFEIQRNIRDIRLPENTDLKDYGRLQRDGELKVQKPGDDRPRPRCVFLFDKIVLMCKQQGETYNFKDAMRVKDYTLEALVPPNASVASQLAPKSREKWIYRFALVEKPSSQPLPTALQGTGSNSQADQNRYIFYANQEQLRNSWMEKFQLALDNLMPAGYHSHGHKFEMKTLLPDASVRECCACDKLLRGLFFQGYQCHGCHSIAHKECLQACGPCTNRSLPVRLPPRVPSFEVPSMIAQQQLSDRQSPHRHSEHSMRDRVLPAIPSTSQAFHLGSHSSTTSAFAPLQREGLGRHSTPPLLRITSNRPTLSPPIDSTPAQINRKSTGVMLPEHAGRHVSELIPDSHTVANGSVPSVVSVCDLSGYPWFGGTMTRPAAEASLSRFSSGTFLVRISVNTGQFALSFRYRDGVLHIEIKQKPDRSFYIVDDRSFKSVPELISYYQEENLKYFFPDIDTTLRTPYGSAVC